MIKNKFKLGLAIGLMALIAGVNAALASNLSWSADTDITAGMTIKSGSVAKSLVVDASSMDVVMSSADGLNATFTVTSTGTISVSGTVGTGNTLSNAGCSAGISTVIITEGGTNDTGTMTFTPTGSQCPTGGSGGSGGGGGGGSSTPSDTTAPINGFVTINAGAATTNTTSVTLSLGAADSSGVSNMSVSNDVNFTGAIWENYATTKNWTLTSGNGLKTVYAKFRDTVGNVSAAVSDTITLDTTVAVVPPPPPSTTPTQAEIIANLQAQINALIAQINALTVGNSGHIPPGILTKALNIGSKGNEVIVLQNFLKAQGDFTDGITGFFGQLTLAAVKHFQVRMGISGPGLPGYGVVGPKTRAKINSMM